MCSVSVMKLGVVDVEVCMSGHLKEELAWAEGKWLWVVNTVML